MEYENTGSYSRRSLPFSPLLCFSPSPLPLPFLRLPRRLTTLIIRVVCVLTPRLFSHSSLSWCWKYLKSWWKGAAELHISVDLLCCTTASEPHNSVDLVCGTTAAELYSSVDLLCGTTVTELHNSVDLLCRTTADEMHNSVDLLCGTTAAELKNPVSLMRAPGDALFPKKVTNHTNNKQNTQHKLGVAFSYLERDYPNNYMSTISLQAAALKNGCLAWVNSRK